MDDDKLKELSLRLERIERALDTAVRRPGTEELSAEELRAYAKVKAALGDWGTCGINETSPCVVACRFIPRLCLPPPPCRACDVECTCGPCGPGGFGGGFGGGGRFGGLGG